MNFNKKIKLDLINELLKLDLFFIKNPYDYLLSFLSKIWDLKIMPSSDKRFKNAYEDINQHIINNNDWSLEELFIERLNILENDNEFNNFLEEIVRPNYYNSLNDLEELVILINNHIRKEEYILSILEYDENDYPIYKLAEISDDFLKDLGKNSILFNVIHDLSKGYNAILREYIPNLFPSFLLIYNPTWNDYNYVTEYTLFYYKDPSTNYQEIGKIKITDGTSRVTREKLPSKFYELDNIFCSLGQNEDFYFNLRTIEPIKFESILYSLRDSAFFSHIYEEFQNNEIFEKSLIRDDKVEKLRRIIKYKIYDFDLNNLYKFKYNFRPKYSEEKIEFTFNFSEEYPKILSNRVYAIIGKNGTGKTQFISSLPLDISRKSKDKFYPKIPIFSKVIAVSYSSFDNFDIPESTTSFNYVFCGLVDKNKKSLNDDQLLSKFRDNWDKITKLNRIFDYKNILLNFIDESIINTFIIKNEELLGNFEFNLNAFKQIRKNLSSGQSILLFSITEIITNIRLDSLLLFDEPETHLHPNAISQLINTIQDLCIKFESYCIITTHSPQIIQGLFSKNVLVMERHEDNIASIRKIGFESFGENLTILTEEVFGNKEIEKSYKKILEQLSKTGQNYDEIVKELEEHDIELNLNARLYLKAITENEKH